MLLLKATERNWGLIGPGDWEKRTWKINTDGTYLRKTRYRPVDPDDPGEHEEAAEGMLSREQMDILESCIDEYWNDETAAADGGSAWEFKLYDNETVVRHRELGYIGGIEPYESIAGLLSEEE